MKVAASSIAGFLSLVNDSDTTMYVGGRAVGAGEARDMPLGEAAPYLDPDNPEHAAFLPLAGPAPASAEELEAEELVAEMGAAFLCSLTGVDGRLQHAEYLQSWISVLKSDKRAIVMAASAAQKAADFITREQVEESEELAA